MARERVRASRESKLLPAARPTAAHLPKPQRLAVARALVPNAVVPHPKPPPAVRDRDYLAFVRSHPCQHCGKHPPSEASHYGPRGLGRKTDDTKTNALCSGCHRHWHQHGRLPWLNRRETVERFEKWQEDLRAKWHKEA